MRRKLRLLASAATLLVLLLAIGLFFYRVSAQKASGQRSAEAEYTILRNVFVDVQDKTQIQSDELRARLLALYQGSDRLLAAQVLDEGGYAAWKIPAKSRYFALPNEAGSRSGYTAPAWSTIVLDTQLSGGMRLTALYTVFKSSDASKAVLPSFAMLLIWLVALLVFLSLLRKDPEEKVPGIDARKEEPTGEDIVQVSSSTTDQAPENPVVAEGGEAEASSEQEAVEASETQDTTPDEEDIEEQEELEESQRDEAQPEGRPEARDSLADSWLKPSSPRKEASDRRFEETLARLEDEVKEWSSRQATSEARPSPRPTETASPALPKTASDEPPATENGMAEAELQEEFEELEADEEPAPHAEEQPAERKDEEEEELVKEFEEVQAEERAPLRSSSQEAPASQPLIAKDDRRKLADLPLPLSLQNPDLEARLAGELAKSQADLALLLVHCNLAAGSEPIAAALFATLRDYVGSKDLIFELYKGAFAVVLPSVDLGAALKMSEDLADVLATTYGLYKDLDGEAPIYMGISSRSGRPVDAFKLYREASTAVHKAYSGGPSKILAFRPRAE